MELPLAVVFRTHGGRLLLGTLAAVSTFVVFYLMTVFALAWGTGKLGWSRAEFLWAQMAGMVFFGLAIPLSARLADRYDPRSVLAVAAALLAVFGVSPCATAGVGQRACGSAVPVHWPRADGAHHGPLGAALGALFPTAVRYTGASFAFNFAGILGASLTPYIAKWLADHHGLATVGGYIHRGLTAVAGRLAAAVTRRHGNAPLSLKAHERTGLLRGSRTQHESFSRATRLP